jgi:uncharacterized membrane protein
VVLISSSEDINEIGGKKLAFRWTYIILPVSLLAISLILVGVFYRLLPEDVAYRFNEGSPDRWLGQNAITVWLVLPHIACALIAFIIVRIAMFSTRYYPAEDTPITKMIAIMGNMIGLIQVILVFAAIDIFLYNIYEIKLMPLWIFALIVMALGGLVLGFLFVQTIRQYSRQHSNISRE